MEEGILEKESKRRGERERPLCDLLFWGEGRGGSLLQQLLLLYQLIPQLTKPVHIRMASIVTSCMKGMPPLWMPVLRIFL